MSELLSINVNDHVEKKNGLTYLSWAWAWAEVLKIDPQATWEHLEFNAPDQQSDMLLHMDDGTCMVGVQVRIKDITRRCLLPVMDHRNKAIQGPNAFDVNKAQMRCLAKAIAMHGLGLYIYAGEDLPEGEEAANDEQLQRQATKQSGNGYGKSVAKVDFDSLPMSKQVTLRECSERPLELCEQGDYASAYDAIQALGLDNDDKIAFSSLFAAHHRSALKRVSEQRRKAA